MSEALLRRPVKRTLQVVCALLAFLLVLEIVLLALFPAEGNAGRRQLEAAEATSLAAIEPMPPPAAFDEVVDRSLFSWNREPNLSDEDPTGPNDDVASRWQLTGVVDTGKTRYAIFADRDGKQRLSLKKGMYLEKWQIRDINPEAVELTSETEKRQFRLKEASFPTNRANSPKRPPEVSEEVLERAQID